MQKRTHPVVNVLFVGFGGIIGQIGGLLCTPFLTRVYGPQSYGEWALFMGLVLTFGALASLRYELAVVLPRTHEKALNVFVLCMALAAVVAMGVWAAVVVCSDWLALSLGFTSLARWSWAAPIMVFTFGAQQACVSWHTRMEHFIAVSAVRASLPLTTCAAQLLSPTWLGLQGADGLIFGSLLGNVSTALIALGLLASGSVPRRALSFRGIRQAFVEYRNYPLFTTPYTIISDLRNRVALFAMGAYGHAAMAGHYGFSEKMTRVSVTAVANAIRPVFFQRAAASRLQGMATSVLQSLLFINKVATPLLVLFLFSHSTIYGLLFGPEWRDASIYGVVLAAPLFVLLHTNWLDRAMDVLGKQRLALQLEAAFTALALGSLFAGALLFGNIFHGLVLQAVVCAVCNAIWLVAFYHVAGFDMSGLKKLAAQTVSLAAGWTAALMAVRLIFPTKIQLAISLLLVASFACCTALRYWKLMKTRKDETQLETVIANTNRRTAA